MKWFIYFFLLVSVNKSFAQDSARFVIKADQLVHEIVTAEKIYMYPTFLRGKINFRDGTTVEAPLNYNYLNSEIEFIDNKRDTMAIAEYQMQNIQKILLSKDTFYYDKGYLQQVVRTAAGILARRPVLVVVRREKLGAFNKPASTTGVEALGYFRDYYGSTITTSMRASENITMAYQNEFFFGDNYFSFLPANKKNALKVFPSYRKIITSYLKENSVDFRNSSQLQKLLLYLQ